MLDATGPLAVLLGLAFWAGRRFGRQDKRAEKDRLRILEVVDGDTFRIEIPEAPDLLGTEWLVRLEGCDAPELSSPQEFERSLARAAKEELERILLRAGKIELEDVRRGKYGGRLVARVRAGRQDVAKVLISKGLARPYDGGAREPWSEEDLAGW